MVVQVGMRHKNDSAILYTQTACGDSARVRAWLTERQIEFSEKNVTEDADAMAELASLRVFMTPTLLVGERRVAGYRPAQFEELFESADTDNPEEHS
jgi:glutaredoxin